MKPYFDWTTFLMLIALVAVTALAIGTGIEKYVRYPEYLNVQAPLGSPVSCTCKVVQNVP